MDCNIQCCTLVILVAVVVTCAYSEGICLHGLRTSGFTVPNGDIFLEWGQPLEINCTVYPSTKYNSSSLLFYGGGNKINSSYLDIINKTSIRLRIPKPLIQDALYICKLKTDELNEEGVCLNRVVVGLRPQNVRNFSCTSHNWDDMNCTWTPAENFIKTYYRLVFYLNRVNHSCPPLNSKANYSLNSCYWSASTTPSYRQAYENYTFILEASNSLGNNSWKYIINNFAIVVPDPPSNLSVISTTINSISLQWFIPPGLDNFPPGLIHQVLYKNIYQDWQEVDTKSLCVNKCNNRYRLDLTDLEFANTDYHIKVYCRSAKEDNTRWSDAAFIAVRTLPTVPAGPPRTNMGSFEVSSTYNTHFRDVYLYWQEIPKQWENGNDFKYKIQSVEEDGIVKNIASDDISLFYACFRNLSVNQYRFRLVSENNVGISKHYSEIIVPAGTRIPPIPEQITQIPFNSGTYQLSWKEPKHDSIIDSYTVFWCKNKSDRPYQCSGGLDWTIVKSNLNAKNVSNLTDQQVYQFGVSTNSGTLSSGIIWASCTVLPGRGGGSMKRVNVIHSGSTYIYISWKSDCSNQIGVVSGFHIEYCAMNLSCETSLCNSSELCLNFSTINVGDEITTYNITGLKPYTNYSVFISVNSDKIKGVRSEPRYERTKEDVPDVIESIKVSDVTNTSVVLKWLPPEHKNGILRHYLLHWGNAWKQVGVQFINGFILDGLESSKVYNITVSGCTSVGCGNASRAVSIVTKIGRPSAPFFQFKNINSSKVLSWSLPQASAGNHTYYTVKFQVISDGEVKFDYKVNTTATNASLPWDKCETEGLTNYNLSVRASNVLEDGEVLEGPWSETQEGACLISTPPPHLTAVIPLFAVLLSIVLCIFCALFSQHLWVKFNRMRDISVKLPARLATRPEDKNENHTIHIWNDHMVHEVDTNGYRPSPDEQSLLKEKEEIELIQENTSIDRHSIGCDVIQNSTVIDSNPVPIVETAETAPSTTPSPGYVKLAPSQPSSGYVSFPPLSKGYMMATLPPSPNNISPLPQCSMMSLKQNGINSYNPKPLNSFPEPNHFGDNNMISPINST